MSLELRSPTPIVIGVSGHRDIRPEDVEPLSRAIDDFFGALARRFVHSDLLLLTGLASGADQLAAERALACDVPYIAVLPMPREAYAEDFSATEREAFETLLASAVAVVELPYLDAQSAQSLHANAGGRARQYTALGEFLATHSSVLLALWNGKAVAAPGGTSAVVAAVEEGAVSMHDPSVARPRAFVFHIATPRISEPETEPEPFTTTSLRTDDDRLSTLAAIDRWNERAMKAIAKHGTPPLLRLGPALCTQAFELADALAVRDQTRTHRAIDRVYWYTLISGIMLASYGDLADLDPLFSRGLAMLSVIFVVFTLAAIWTVRDIHGDEVQNRFADYRLLAEGLRVQCALLEAHINVDASDRYPAEQGSELDWIRRTMGVAYFTTTLAHEPAPMSPGGDTGIGMLTIPEWISSQRAYFERASVRNARLAERADRFALLAFRVSVVAATLIALDGLSRLTLGYGLGHVLVRNPRLDNYLKPAFLSAFAWAGLLAAVSKGKSALRAYPLLAKRYARMAAIFGTAQAQLEDVFATPNPQNARYAAPIVIGLADAALAENTGWHSSERSRPLEFMWGG